jgi:hypothetical protein
LLPKLVGDQAVRQEVSDVSKVGDVSGPTTATPAAVALGNLDAREHHWLRHR